jgi:hypothetical protein
MRKLDIILNLAYSLEISLGWCPKPPTTKVESPTYHKDDSPVQNPLKIRREFLLYMIFFSPVFIWFLIFGPPFYVFYIQLIVGIFAMVFFGIVGLANIAHAFQEKENIYYLRITLSFLVCFAGIFLILGNSLLFLIFFITAIAISSLKYYGSRHPSSGVAETK